MKDSPKKLETVHCFYYIKSWKTLPRMTWSTNWLHGSSKWYAFEDTLGENLYKKLLVQRAMEISTPILEYFLLEMTSPNNNKSIGPKLRDVGLMKVFKGSLCDHQCFHESSKWQLTAKINFGTSSSENVCGATVLVATSQFTRNYALQRLGFNSLTLWQTSKTPKN